MKQHSKKTYRYRCRMSELVSFDTIPSFERWPLDPPVQNEYYLVYRVGHVLGINGWVWKPHYTIRRYHNGSFGSNDVKYWIKLSEVRKQTT